MKNSLCYRQLKNTIHNSLWMGWIIVALLTSNIINSQQTALKQLTKEDYSLFSVMNFIEVSPNNKWLSFRLTYESGVDTIFIQNIENGHHRFYPRAQYGAFNNLDWYASKNEEGVRLENLTSGENEIFSSARKFKFTDNGKYFLTSSTNSEGSKDMISKNLISGEVLRLENVDEFIVHPRENEAFIIENSNQGSKIVQIELHNNSKKTVVKSKPNEEFSNLIISENGSSLVFATKSEKQGVVTSLNHYNLRTKTLKEFQSESHPEFKLNTEIALNQSMLIDESSGTVLFYVRDLINTSKEEDIVQVWDTKDIYIYPQKKYQERFSNNKLRCWNTVNDGYFEITNEEFSHAIFNGKSDQLIVWNVGAYEPQYDQIPPRDYYLMDLKSGKKKLFLKKFYPGTSPIYPSPKGKNVAYYKEGNWWLYNTQTNIHSNITAHLETPFFKKNYDMAGKIPTSGPVVWSRDGESLFLEDQFDIWKIDLVSLNYNKLTDGKDKKIKFSLAESSIAEVSQKTFYRNLNQLNSDSSILFKGTSENGGSGYFNWSAGNGLNEIVFSDSRIYNGHKIDNDVLFMEERFDLPTRFMVHKEGKSRVLFQSNQQQELFKWSGEETIYYINSHGKKLRGLLVYPFDFKKDKKYPMIVRIYERQYDEKHTFHIPTVGTSDGYNPVNYANKGYFIFLPDIVYEIGNPAKSAADCTISAVETLLANNEAIDPENVGLIGHSFGAYETNYIVTQTDLFKTAVAGAGLANLESYYLSLEWFSGLPQIWRIENQQMRMNSMLFNNWTGYHENSPLYYAEQMDIPLLTWAGKNDYNVNWDQNVEWFMALRRLNKENIFLLYPDAGHAMVTKKEREDLAFKIEGWFDFYLKDGKKPDWFN